MYNKSEIFTKAWEVKNIRGNRMTFAQCLRRAWQLAKEEVENKKLIGAKFQNNMDITIDGYTRELTRWTKGNLDRVYINGGSKKGDGYIDIANKKACLNGHCDYQVKMAKVILTMEF